MSILKEKNFSLLALAKGISLIGTQMQSFALCLYVLKLTGSSTKFASVLAMALIPQIILGPIVGVFVDWLDKKRLLIYFDLLACILVMMFALIFKINDKLSMESIYILVMLLSIISIIYISTISVVLPCILKRSDLIKANSIMSFITSMSVLISPIFAGILFSFYGLLIIMIFNSISFLISSILEMFIKIPLIKREGIEFNVNTFLKDFKEGFSFIRSKKIMFNLMIIALIYNFSIDAILTIGVPYISKQVIKTSDFQYGLLQSIAMSALLIAPILCNLICKRFIITKILHSGISIITLAIGMIALIFSSYSLNFFKGTVVPYFCLIIIIFIINLLELICSTILVTILQQLTPINILGRVGGLLDSISMIAMPLGVMTYGILFDTFSVSICVGVSTILLIILAISTKPILYNKSIIETVKIKTTIEN